MPISFETIPSNLRVPGTYIEVSNRRASQGAFVGNQKSLLIGQKLSSGTAPVNVPILVTTATEASALFGRGSMVQAMVDAFKQNNKYTECWVMPIADNGAGVQATGTVVFSGTPLETGLINLYLAGKRIQVPVSTADTASTLATKLVALITDEAPVTATASTGTVTLTAKHKGEVGNDIDLRVNYLGTTGGERTPAGVTVVLTAFASGAGNPTTATALVLLPEEVYNFIAFPYQDTTNLNALQAELENRWSGTMMKEGHAFSAGTASSINGLITLGLTRNDPHVTRLAFSRDALLTPVHEVAAAYTAVVAQSATNDPALPLQTLELKGVLATTAFDPTERNTLLFNGWATYSKTVDGKVLLERAVTTYRVTATGIPDVSFLDSETPLTVAYLRQDLRGFLASRFPRFKLVNDGEPASAGANTVTPNVVRTEIIARFLFWQELGLVEDLEQFKTDLVVQRNANDPNRLDALLPPNLVNQLRVVAGKIEFLL
jgi:phage tail sheath gpL-like